MNAKSYVNGHCGSIVSLASTYNMARPLLMTCSSDNDVKVWNFVERRMELSYNFGQETGSTGTQALCC